MPPSPTRSTTEHSPRWRTRSATWSTPRRWFRSSGSRRRDTPPDVAGISLALSPRDGRAMRPHRQQQQESASPMFSRRDFLIGATAAASSPAIPAWAAGAQVLRIGMTASDLPSTHGIPNNGGEGYRFLGYPAYDSVVNWDFRHVDQTADITPGLFAAWKNDEGNPNRWICSVRQGVRFHDGSAFDADAVIFNLRRIFDDKSPQY